MRRGTVTLCVVIVCALVPVAAGAATTTTTSPTPGSTASSTTTTTTIPPSSVPPPPPFALPTDYGLQLIQTQQKAQAALAAARLGLPDAQKQADAAKRDDKRAQLQLKKLRADVQANERKLVATKQHLRAAAATAYMHADSGELVAAVFSLTDANSAVDVASQLHMINGYGSNERDALADYLSLKGRLAAQLDQITTLSRRTAASLASAQQRLSDTKNQITVAVTQIAGTMTDMVKFEAAATSATSPILGPSRLSANQMADFVMLSGYKPDITVPVRTLAQYYLDEGAKTGVRGDVAFAQSILETAGFANPGSAPTDNNFAGIGWCDTCAHGYDFPDAQTGVRAQMQLLRIYVDPKFPDLTYTDPILLPGSLKLGFRGKVQTWWDLWGTWATGALYGQRVYDIYEKMVAFSALDPPQAAIEPVATPPAAGGAVTRPPDSGPGTK